VEHGSVAAVKQSNLGRGHASRVAVPVAPQRWPEPADVLPGPVRDVVATVTGVRALVVTLDKRQRVHRLELDDQDGKTVARVELDAPVTAPARLTARRSAWLRRTVAMGRA